MSVEFKDNSLLLMWHLYRGMKNGLDAIGNRAATYARLDTPVDTGRLRNSITYKVKGKEAYIGTNVEYAPYVELGARGRPGVYMLRNAATNHSEEYKGLLEAAIKAEID